MRVSCCKIKCQPLSDWMPVGGAYGERRLFVDVLLWRRCLCKWLFPVTSSCPLKSERDIFEAWLNKCFVYNEDVLSYVLMVQRPIICQKIKANLISHVMTPLRGDVFVLEEQKNNSFYMHMSIFRFWAFWFFIKCFYRLVERKHP